MGVYIDENGNEQTTEKKIVPLKKEMFPALAGYSKRRLLRQNTVHLDGFCPSCGSRCRYVKKTPYGTKGGKSTYASKWICQNRECNMKWDRKDFKYVKYNHV